MKHKNNEIETPRTLTELLSDISDQLKKIEHTTDIKKEFTLGALLDQLHERGIAFALLFLAIQMALPIPVPPGINILLASPLIILAAHMALGAHSITLPESLKKKKVSKKGFIKLVDTSIPYIEKIEYLIKPRFAFISQGLSSRIFGVAALLMALCICIPLPLTNTIPSLGIAIMAVGFIMRDGLAVILGTIIGICWIALLLWATLFFGAEAVEVIKTTIKAFL